MSAHRATRASAAGTVVAVAVAMALSGCGDDDVASEQTPRPLVSPSRLEVADEIDTQGRPQVVSVTLAEGDLLGDTGLTYVREDSKVQLTVLADVLDVVEVEGYGLELRTEVGRPVKITFPATEPGQFEVRLREAGTVLTTLDVR